MVIYIVKELKQLESYTKINIFKLFFYNTYENNNIWNHIITYFPNIKYINFDNYDYAFRCFDFCAQRSYKEIEDKLYNEYLTYSTATYQSDMKQIEKSDLVINSS